ncbi:MAG TPA: PEP-CTERM sorting domain-containing protein [Gammaproteobacteria bacterium]|nr:PEP-CTERM sorting domain-containing protein [Gammaproteobacteria bacterium]
MKKMMDALLLAAVVLGFLSQPVFATPISGLMTIDPGLRIPRLGYVSGSYFAMFANNPNSGAAMLAPGSAGGLTLGSYQPFVLNPDVPHPHSPFGPGTGYSGTPTSISSLLAPFGFFGVPTYVGTNPVSYQSGNAHPVPTASYDPASCVGTVCQLSMTLDAWEVMWNGSAFEQGPRPSNSGPFVPAVGTYDLSSHAYAVTWASQIKNGPFNGVTGYWHLSGVVEPVSTVPEPPTLALFAVGLLALVGSIRRWTRS